MKLPKSLHAAIAMLLFSGTTAAVAQTECWVYGKKENKAKLHYHVDSVYVKDTFISAKGFSSYGILISYSKPGSKDGSTFGKLNGDGRFFNCLKAKVVNKSGVTNTYGYNLKEAASGGVSLLTFPEGTTDFKSKDPELETELTNICGHTDHFKPAYTYAGNGWHAIAMAFTEGSNDGCSNDMRIEEFSISGNGVSINGGSILINDNSTITITSGSTIFNSIANPVSITFLGRDGRGASARYELTLTPEFGTGAINQNFTMGKNNGSFTITSAEVVIGSFCGTKTNLSGSYDGKDSRTTFAILFKGNKRPAKYGQCMVFAGKVKDSSLIVRLPDLLADVTVYKESGDKPKPIFGAVLAINSTKKEKAAEINAMIAWGTVRPVMRVRYQDDKNTSITRQIDPTWDNTSAGYVFADKFAIENESSQWHIDDVSLWLKNDCGDTFLLPAKLKGDGGAGGADNYKSWTETWNLIQRFTDQCASDADLNKPSATAVRVSGLYAVSYSFGLGNNSDMPSAIVINTEIVNCKGDVKYVEAKLKYDSKTGTWTGGFAISDESSCEWKVKDISMKVYNECGNTVEKGNYPTLIQKMKDKIAKGDV